MTEPTAADDHEYALQLFKRRMAAILADHECPASTEHVREVVLAWAGGGPKRGVLAQLLEGRWGTEDRNHPWIKRNRELLDAWTNLMRPD